MGEKVGQILKEVLNKVSPPKEDLNEIKDYLGKFLEQFNGEIKKKKMKIDVFVGGSFAKKTVIKKDSYDVDIFVRFDVEEFRDREISEVLRELIKSSGYEPHEIHGSRDYFRLKPNDKFSLEIVPVMKVAKPSEAENITDLSYSHVKYINKKIKDSRILDEIKITKAFCYATGTYGAESYIHGFSGYAIELLVYKYRSFLNFAKAVVKSNGKEKIIIDIEKFYKNKNEVLMNINSAKIQAPIILIDPTFKQRNVTAALSEETFQKFKTACKEFLKKPSIKSFEIQLVNLEKIKSNALRKKFEFCLIEIKTDRQEGDIAGSKLLKFYNFLTNELTRYFEVKDSGFEYDGKHAGKIFVIVKSKKDVVFGGPRTDDKKNVSAFKKRHKKVFVKGKNIYAKEEFDFRMKDFLEKWKTKNYGRTIEMDVSEFNILI